LATGAVDPHDPRVAGLGDAQIERAGDRDPAAREAHGQLAVVVEGELLPDLDSGDRGWRPPILRRPRRRIAASDCKKEDNDARENRIRTHPGTVAS
jgi:hypothetical protein